MVGKSSLRRVVESTGLYFVVALYVLFALFPIYWTVKISVTPQNLLYSEGIKLWPGKMTLANYHSVLAASDFPRYFLNSMIVSISTSLLVTAIASLAGYALSRFMFPAKVWVSLLLLLTQDLVCLVALQSMDERLGMVLDPSQEFNLVGHLDEIVVGAGSK